MSEKLGVMLCGHGSRDEDAVAEFAVLAERLSVRLPDWPVEYGYLEFARPIIREGLDRLRARGDLRLGLAHQEHRNFRLAQNGLGDRAEEQPAKAAPPVRRHRDEVSGPLAGRFHDLGEGVAGTNFGHGAQTARAHALDDFAKQFVVKTEGAAA